ncbi:hypothetical protein NMY22_g11502 [Coprinellus aureogranulatus]|nr:hypothetical protein NMY22_g11502 [Coprinellus aureogranulatus]
MAPGLIESYNRTRYVEELLYKTDGQPPSFTVHLHPEYWILNNGSKFLYHNQILVLELTGELTLLPQKLFDSARVPFHEGRPLRILVHGSLMRSRMYGCGTPGLSLPKFNQPQPEKPERTRVILHPNPETLYADICSMNMKNGGTWTDRDALEVESKLLLATSPPLCLDPNAHLTRVANLVLRASTPTVPVSLKRKAATLDPEEEGSERARRNAMMGRFRGRSDDRISTPSFSILDTLYNFRKAMPSHMPTVSRVPRTVSLVQHSPRRCSPLLSQVVGELRLRLYGGMWFQSECLRRSRYSTAIPLSGCPGVLRLVQEHKGLSGGSPASYGSGPPTSPRPRIRLRSRLVKSYCPSSFLLPYDSSVFFSPASYNCFLTDQAVVIPPTHVMGSAVPSASREHEAARAGW